MDCPTLLQEGVQSKTFLIRMDTTCSKFYHIMLQCASQGAGCTKCRVQTMARKRFEFWLNDQRDEDWLVYDLINKLKKPSKGQGQFTRAIREGIRLWVSLRNGQIDV